MTLRRAHALLARVGGAVAGAGRFGEAARTEVAAMLSAVSEDIVAVRNQNTQGWQLVSQQAAER